MRERAAVVGVVAGLASAVPCGPAPPFVVVVAVVVPDAVEEEEDLVACNAVEATGVPAAPPLSEGADEPAFPLCDRVAFSFDVELVPVCPVAMGVSGAGEELVPLPPTSPSPVAKLMLARAADRVRLEEGAGEPLVESATDASLPAAGEPGPISSLRFLRFVVLRSSVYGDVCRGRTGRVEAKCMLVL